MHYLRHATFVTTAMFVLMLHCTSSNFSAIMENALKMPSVGPVMVTILSGDDPSDMLMRAPLWKHNKSPSLFQPYILQGMCVPTNDFWVSRMRNVQVNAHLLPHFLYCFSFLDSCRKQWNKRVWLVTVKKKKTQPTQCSEQYLANYAADFLQYIDNKGWATFHQTGYHHMNTGNH